VAKRSSRSEQSPRTLRLKSGTEIALDGDVVFLIDALFRDFAVERAFAPAYADVQRELEGVFAKMDEDERREYFCASLFLNYVTYENEMAERLAEKITKRAKRAPSKSRR